MTDSTTVKPKTLKQYVLGLNRFLREHPELANVIVVSSSDEEGNNYDSVFYDPTPGHYDGSREFDSGGDGEVNAVCIN